MVEISQNFAAFSEYINFTHWQKVKSMSTFPPTFIIIRLIVESRLSGFLRKFNEFSKAHYHNLFFGLLLLKGSQYGRKFKSLSKNISSNNRRNNYSFLKMKYCEFSNVVAIILLFCMQQMLSKGGKLFKEGKCQ